MFCSPCSSVQSGFGSIRQIRIEVAHEIMDGFLKRSASGPAPDFFAASAGGQSRRIQCDPPVGGEFQNRKVAIGVSPDQTCQQLYERVAVGLDSD